MGDKFDKFNMEDKNEDEPVLDESILYLSSNWSARMSLKTQHDYPKLNDGENKIIPTLDIQKVLDLPDSDDEKDKDKVNDGQEDQPFEIIKQNPPSELQNLSLQ